MEKLEIDLKETQTIVIVDDENMVLVSIEAFLDLETNYNIKTFTTPAEALVFIKHNDAHLVISDYLMPEMNGIEFLSEVRIIKPQIPRIILTGYADKENAIKAINTVGLYQYIEKPWNNDDLLIVLRNGLDKQNLLSKLENKISEINKAYDELRSLQNEIVKTFI